ncbi:transglutaminase-like domain-containing protein [Microbacterium album]|nr:transglutaminase-like domain-containing protein [Microbacterium album]
MAVLVGLGLSPLYAAYQSADFWVAGIGGTMLGTAIALVAWRVRAHPLTTAVLVVAAYFAFGGALALRSASPLGFVPTLEVLAALAVGAVHVWKQALTLPDPLVGFEQLTIAPFALGLVGSAVAVSLAVRLRSSGWALMTPGAVLAIGVAFSTYLGFVPSAVGAAFAAVALAWAAWRARARRAGSVAGPETGAVDSARGRGLRAGAIAAAGVVIASCIVGGVTAAAAGGALTRDVLRDRIVPPLELHDFATPLTSFRRMVTQGEEARLFTVTGVPAGTRIRLATLDAYDGTVYLVSGSGGAGSGVFSRVGRQIDNDVAGESVRATVEVHDLEGVWAPTVGYLDAIRFEGGGAATRAEALHYNRASGTAVVTTGLTPGETYVLDAVIPDTPSEEQLATAELAAVRTPTPDLVPDGVLLALDEATTDAGTPIEQVRAVEAYLQTNGFFSHGLEGQVASRSGHTVSRLDDLLRGTQMIGDDEQYATAMALMVAQLGIPVRVVMGFIPSAEAGEGPVTVTGEDAHVWVEVPFRDLGWVPFWPTPAEDKVPQEQTPEQRQKPRVQVAQPPDVPQEPAELPPPPPVEEAVDDETPPEEEWLWFALSIAGASLLILLILLGPSIALGIVRGVRRRRRRSAERLADRVHGGWAELLDEASDVGAAVPVGATRREQALALDAQHPIARVAELAARADVAVFGAHEPTAEEVERYWADVATARRGLRSGVPWHRRLRARLFPASVLRGMRRPARRPARAELPRRGGAA